MSSSSQPKKPEKPLGGRYKVVSQLGTGGFGQTFLAEDMHLPGHPRCVVKQFKPQTSDPDTLQMARRLFDTEARVLYQLGNHDQIPRLLAHFEDNEEFYLAQELIEGDPLTKELVKGKHWPQDKVITLLQDLLQILVFVHHKQVIHRDIKPPNLIRRKHDSRIVLIDFGAVKQVSTQTVNPDTGETNLTISIGTKGYMPHEQLLGNPRFSSDIYAVGLIGIQALTGIKPKYLKEDARGELDWRKHAKQVSPELAKVLERMVCYDFRDRYPTASQALEALRSLPAKLLESVPALQVAPLPQSEPDITALLEEADVPTMQVSAIEPRETAALEEADVPTMQAPPPRRTESTESEIELSSTNIWVPGESLEESPTASTTASNASSTESLSQLQPSLPASEPSTPTPAESRNTPLKFIPRRLVKLWPAAAIFVAVGTTFAMTKTFLYSQSDNLVNVPNPTPTVSLTEDSPITPTPLEPKEQAAVLLKQANKLRENEQYEEALETYDRVIELKSDEAKAYWGRCYSLNKLKKPADAMVACNDALDLEPEYPEALWSKGKALDLQDRSIEAMRFYEQATALKPDLAEAWLDLGIVRQKYGRSVEAIEALDKSIELERNSADAWSTKGEALWNLGRQDEGIAALDKALQIEPDHPMASKLRQDIREELGR